MIERLLETWVNRANERSFQIPFAHWLAYKGHTVLHVSRHCGMEIGKDILTIDPYGVPCAFQLKGVAGGGRMTQNQWRDDLSRQIHPLVHAAIVHPSLALPRQHRSFIVTNGTFDEEVTREIDDFNRGMQNAGQPERVVTTFVKGQLISAFKELQSDFWATNLNDLKTYLELYLEDGKGQLPKRKLATLFEDALPLGKDDQQPGNAAIGRALAGCAVICSAAVSAFTAEANHASEFEAWTLYLSYVYALAQRWNVNSEAIRFAVGLASDAMYSSLARLCEELGTRERFVEGDVMVDRLVYEIRMTYLLGLMGLFGLWSMRRLQIGETVDRKHIEVASAFCNAHHNKLRLWGEYAVPQFLAWSFFRRMEDASDFTDHIYRSLVEALSVKNAPGSEDAIANAYYEPEELIPHLLGLSPKPLAESFTGKSHYLESLLHLFVRANYKQYVKLAFPKVTRISFREFQPSQPWHFFFYRNWNSGINIERYLVPPHSWVTLRENALESSGAGIPTVLRDEPIHYLALMLVMPHRGNSSGVRWLATQFDEWSQNKVWMC